jgi:ketosteroid isomerase-like protein
VSDSANVELHQRWIEAFNARDVDAIVASCDPRIEFQSTFAAVGGGVYRGHDGVRAWHKDLEEAWGEEIRLDADVFFELEENTLVCFAFQARGKQSGAEVAMPAAAAARWRDGLCVYWKAYADAAEAFADLGVTEDELEPIAP